MWNYPTHFKPIDVNIVLIGEKMFTINVVDWYYTHMLVFWYLILKKSVCPILEVIQNGVQDGANNMWIVSMQIMI